MEVLFISYKYPPSIGGMQKQSYELINGFKQYQTSHSIIYDQTSSLVFFFISLFWKVPQLLKANQEIKIIHFNDGVCAICCAWMRIFKNISLVVTYHGLDLVFPNLIYQKILLPIIRKFEGVITVSQHTKLECIKRGFDSSKIHVVNNGVDVNQEIDIKKLDKNLLTTLDQIKNSEKKIIVAIGRPVMRKGFVWFVSKILPRLDQNNVFILIGPSPKPSFFRERVLPMLPKILYKQIVLFFGLSTEHNKLIELKKSHSHNFYWFDDLDHNSKLHLLTEADLMVMPNIKVKGDMEGFGLVALEANIQNTPVLASKLEGITSAVVNKKNGLLIEPSNCDAWVMAIKSFFNTKKKLNCRAYTIAHYSWDKMILDYRKVFSQIA